MREATKCVSSLCFTHGSAAITDSVSSSSRVAARSCSLCPPPPGVGDRPSAPVPWSPHELPACADAPPRRRMLRPTEGLGNSAVSVCGDSPGVRPAGLANYRIGAERVIAALLWLRGRASVSRPPPTPGCALARLLTPAPTCLFLLTPLPPTSARLGSAKRFPLMRMPRWSEENCGNLGAAMRGVT